MIERVFAALSHSAASGSKTTALSPLHMMLALVLSGFLVSALSNLPTWVISFFGYASAGVLMLEAGAYVYLLVNDRDALRSERFTIAKMRIERGVMGDTSSGFHEVPEGESHRALPAGRSEREN